MFSAHQIHGSPYEISMLIYVMCFPPSLPQTKIMKHSSGLCLDVSDKSREEPSVKPCNGGRSQKWELNAFDWKG